MGEVTLGGRLQARLLIALAPTLAVLAAVAVFVTSRSLDAFDTSRARSLGAGVVQALESEGAKHEPRAEAERDALAAVRVPSQRVSIRGAASAGQLPSHLADLTPGSCASAKEAGETWRGCAMGSGANIVIAAVRTSAHAGVVRVLALWMSMTVVLALVVSVLSIRRAVRVQLAAVRALARWARREIKDAPPPRDDTAELRDLSDAFEHLVADLRAAVERERAQSAHIAHELRTPLTAMIGELAAMPSSPGDGIARLRADAARLARVIDAILVLSSPPSQRQVVVVNVADVARKLAPTGVDVTAPDEALVEAERDLLEIAVNNVLENAAKHAPGPTAVTVTREADAVRIAVRDHGPGLDAVGRGRMFERFWRESAAGGGTGLGLALVQAVAQRHGGVAEARPIAGESGLEVGFSIAPLLAWHDQPPSPS